MLLTALMYALFGSVFTAAKLGLAQSEPFFMLGVRMLLGGGLMLLFQLIFNRRGLVLQRKHLPLLLSLTVFNVYLTNGLEFWGMRYITTSKTSFLYSLTPFISALLSFVFFREVLSKRKWLGLVIGFAGFMPILYTQNPDEFSLASFGFISSAELSVIGAATCAVLGMMSMQNLLQKGDISVLTANGYSMFFGGVLGTIHSIFTESWQPTPMFGELDHFIEAVIWMVVVSSFICYNLWGYLLRSYTVTFLAFSGFLTPFFTAGASWLVIGERVDSTFWLSAVIVFSGLAMFYSEELKQEGIAKQPEKGTAQSVL